MKSRERKDPTAIVPCSRDLIENLPGKTPASVRLRCSSCPLRSLLPRQRRISKGDTRWVQSRIGQAAHIQLCTHRVSPLLIRRCLGSKERSGPEEHRRGTDAGVFPGRLSEQIPTARHNRGGVFPLSALHRQTPSATNREPTLPQAPERMQVPRPVGFSVRPFSLLRPVVRRVSRRVLHPALVATPQLPAV